MLFYYLVCVTWVKCRNLKYFLVLNVNTTKTFSYFIYFSLKVSLLKSYLKEFKKQTNKTP